jgi:hypothetical protein
MARRLRTLICSALVNMWHAAEGDRTQYSDEFIGWIIRDTIPAWSKWFSCTPKIRNNCGVHPTFHSIGNEGSLTVDNTTVAWCWPPTSSSAVTAQGSVFRSRTRRTDEKLCWSFGWLNCEGRTEQLLTLYWHLYGTELLCNFNVSFVFVEVIWLGRRRTRGHELICICVSSGYRLVVNGHACWMHGIIYMMRNEHARGKECRELSKNRRRLIHCAVGKGVKCKYCISEEGVCNLLEIVQGLWVNE